MAALDGASQAQLRVLCLHSYRTNAKIFKAQLQAAGWTSAFPNVDFVCIDGVYECDDKDEQEMARGVIDGVRGGVHFMRLLVGLYARGPLREAILRQNLVLLRIITEVQVFIFINSIVSSLI